MFNGIIFNTGKAVYLKKKRNSLLLGIETNIKFYNRDVGLSVSCNGVCLTVERIKKNIVYFYISNETLSRSNFRFLKKNQIINLEKSLIFGQSISGHFIQGHVDSVAKIKYVKIIDKSWLIKFQLLNKKLNKFLIEKASISINGVSLTISSVYENYFEINVIPHTLKLTNLKNLVKNNLVNVELDIIGKYINKYSN